MPHSFSLAVSMNLEHSIKEESHERYPVHLQCLGNIKKIKYPDFQAMTLTTQDTHCTSISPTPNWKQTTHLAEYTACTMHLLYMAN